MGLGPGPGALGACALGRRKGCLGLKHGMARLKPWKRGMARLEPWEGGVTGTKQWKKGYSVRLETKSLKKSLKMLASGQNLERFLGGFVFKTYQLSLFHCLVSATPPSHGSSLVLPLFHGSSLAIPLFHGSGLAIPLFHGSGLAIPLFHASGLGTPS